jgi:hypothetical protein
MVVSTACAISLYVNKPNPVAKRKAAALIIFIALISSPRYG